MGNLWQTGDSSMLTIDIMAPTLASTMALPSPAFGSGIGM